MIGNSYLELTPKEALEAICKMCQEDYSKGKRKININRIWKIAEAGRTYDPDTSTNPRPCKPKGVIG